MSDPPGESEFDSDSTFRRRRGRFARRWNHTRAHWWFIRNFSPLTMVQYVATQEARRRECEASECGIALPLSHGERMLYALRATPEQLAEARRRGFA